MSYLGKGTTELSTSGAAQDVTSAVTADQLLQLLHLPGPLHLLVPLECLPGRGTRQWQLKMLG